MRNQTKQLISLLIIALLLLIACTPLQLTASSPLQTRTAVAPNRAAAPDEITMIGLKRSGCFGFCPGYELTIFGDGRVVYRGGGYVDFADFPLHRFGRLCYNYTKGAK